MQRYDTARGVWRDVAGTGELVRVLIAAGAPVDGTPDERETPLITAASYGDAAVGRVLIEAGADLEAHAADDSGGVPGGTALRGHPLRTAASNGRPSSVRRLLAHGADPGLRDEDGRRPLDLCRAGTTLAHREVEAILTPLADTAHST